MKMAKIIVKTLNGVEILDKTTTSNLEVEESDQRLKIKLVKAEKTNNEYSMSLSDILYYEILNENNKIRRIEITLKVNKNGQD